MIQEVTQANYLGVLRSRCYERTPVPKNFAAFYEEPKHGALNESQDANPRAITLRCKACNGESVYGMDEI